MKRAFLQKLTPGEEGNGRTLTARLMIETLKQQSGLELDDLRAVWHTGLFPGGEELRLPDARLALHRELWALIGNLGIASHVAVMGNIWEWLPDLYAVTDVYCSPSVMEGFGMSAQEAAASGVPVVASHLVPFVTEYLLGDAVEVCEFEGNSQPVKRGEGAVVVQADDVNGFACALEMLLTNDRLRKELGENAYRITIPRFTWRNTVPAFLDEIDVSP